LFADIERPTQRKTEKRRGRNDGALIKPGKGQTTRIACHLSGEGSKMGGKKPKELELQGKATAYYPYDERTQTRQEETGRAEFWEGGEFLSSQGGLGGGGTEKGRKKNLKLD